MCLFIYLKNPDTQISETFKRRLGRSAFSYYSLFTLVKSDGCSNHRSESSWTQWGLRISAKHCPHTLMTSLIRSKCQLDQLSLMVGLNRGFPVKNLSYQSQLFVGIGIIYIYRYFDFCPCWDLRRLDLAYRKTDYEVGPRDAQVEWIKLSKK